MKNKISEVQIIPIKPQNGLIAFASLVLNEEFYLGSIGIHQKLNGQGYRLTYPTKKVADRNINIYHPINKEISIEIEKEIFNKLKEVMSKSNDRHNNPYIAERVF
jgi:stage V sporulation protein G